MSSAFNMGSLLETGSRSGRSADGVAVATPPHRPGEAAAPAGRRDRCLRVRWGGYFTVAKGSPPAPSTPVRLTGRAAAEHPPVAHAQRDARRVAVLEQGLGVLAGGAEVVAQARDRHLAVALDQLGDAALDRGQ